MELSGMHGGRSHRRPRLEMEAQTDAPNQLEEALGMTVKRKAARSREQADKFACRAWRATKQTPPGGHDCGCGTFAPTYTTSRCYQRPQLRWRRPSHQYSSGRSYRRHSESVLRRPSRGRWRTGSDTNRMSSRRSPLEVRASGVPLNDRDVNDAGCTRATLALAPVAAASG